MQENSGDISIKEEVLDLTADSNEDILKQEECSNLKVISDCNYYARNSSVSRERESIPLNLVECKSETKDFTRCKSIRAFNQTLDKAIAEIRKGGSLDGTAFKHGIPQDVIYSRLIARNLPKETDILTPHEEFRLVQWILRENKNNSIVMKNNLLEKVGKIKKVSDITPIFAKSKFGKMWYEHFLQRYPEIYENDSILMPSEVNGSHNKNTNHPETFLSGPLKLKENCAQQLRVLGFKEALVILHDFRLESKQIERRPKEEFRPILPDTKKNWMMEDNKHKCRSTTHDTKFDRGYMSGDSKSEKISSDEESDVKAKTRYRQNKPLNDGNCSRTDNTQSKAFTIKQESCTRNNKNEDAFKEANRPMCTKCNKTFCNKSKLIRHLYSHMPEDQYTFECNACLKRFPSEYHLSVHVNICHSTKIYHCDDCNSTFKHNTSLRKHKRTVHLDLKGGGSVESRSFTCDVCKKAFSYKKSLKYHILYGHLQQMKKYPCSVCRKRFIKYSLMLRHKLRHVKIKPFTCNSCNKSFSRKYLHREHANRCKNKLVPKEEDCKKLSIDYLRKLDLD